MNSIPVFVFRKQTEIYPPQWFFPTEPHFLILLLGAALRFHITRMRHQADPTKAFGTSFYGCFLKMRLNLWCVWESESHLPPRTCLPLKRRGQIPQNAAKWSLTRQAQILSHTQARATRPLLHRRHFFFFLHPAVLLIKKNFIDHLCHSSRPSRLPCLFM